MKKIDSTKRYEKLREAVGNGDVDRRTFFGLMGSAAITAGVAGGAMTSMARMAHAAGTELHFEGWGGVVAKTVCLDAARIVNAFVEEGVLIRTEGSDGQPVARGPGAPEADARVA